MAKLDYRGFVDDGSDDLTIDGSVVFAESPIATVKTATTTPIVGGVYEVSGVAAVTVSMPLASTVPGAQFVFRSTSAHAHVLTGSAWAKGERAFAGISGSAGIVDGAAIVFPAIIGTSVVLVSDGNKYLYTGGSGSIKIMETYP